MTSELYTRFCNILLPVPIPKLFTYRVPLEFNERVQQLQRVIVPFGPKKILTGVIIEIHETPPADYEAKMILDLLDPIPILFNQQIELIKWISQYYMCSEGEVLNAALPAGLKLSSESMVQINPSFEWDNPAFDFSEKEWSLLNRLRYDTLSYSDVSKFLGVKNIYTILRSLVSKQAIFLLEEIKDKFSPKTIKYLRFNVEFLDKKKLEVLFESISSKPKQEAALLKILQLLPVFQNADLNKDGVAFSKVASEDISTSSLKTLVKQGVLEEFDKIVSRFDEFINSNIELPVLSEEQQKVRDQILSYFQEDKPVILQGVTGSGKTEIYIDLLKKAIDNNTQALLLLPEIALTTQIVSRIKRIFGNQLGVYHSKFSDNERVEIWNGIVSGKLKCIVGVRSGVFLPFDNLGLVIVDEEHDTSYKQDRPPRYHARNTALMLGKIHHAKVLLGSATPSLESYYQGMIGNYGLVKLTNRYQEASLPQIQMVNLSEERKRKSIKGSVSGTLYKAMEEALERKEQIILFQNRRGYSPFIECEDCGHVPGCINCSVSLTYHQYKHALVCHYCGYHEELPKTCPSCSSSRMLTMGLGTEKLEEEVKILFPDASVQRMDLETTRSKSSYANIIEAFERGETDILIGTQMISKGLDFGRVNLVGVFDADRLLHFPDFRSYERAFQLITQVSGRAGRRGGEGKVLIQTYNPVHPIYRLISVSNIDLFLENELRDRESNSYPPFTRLIEITFKHTDKRTCFEATLWYARRIVQTSNVKLMGPAEPIISKIRNEYWYTLLLKIPRSSINLIYFKNELLRLGSELITHTKFARSKIVVDVDPN